MEEQASFEARAVLAPRRARLARLALLLPVVALTAIAWAGLSGARSDQAIAEIPDPTALAAPSLRAPEHPAQVIGLAVHRLDDVQPRGLGRDDVIAVAGWYVPTAITDCPPLDAIYRDGALPYLRGDADRFAFCVRSGVLYASRPDLEDGRPGSTGPRAVAATLAVGIIAPPQLELIGMDATEVVVVGRFLGFGDGCRVLATCRRELVVDHVAWTPGA
jgi:hypothetical protein